MNIAVDAMGGDYAPVEVVAGALEAVREGIAEVTLVGDTNVLEAMLPGKIPGLRLVQASEVVGMDEQPAVALRKKRNTSIGLATRLVKEGEASALVSAGNTGAQMVAALLELGRIQGVQRPAIATVLPTLKGARLLLDVGANVDCKPLNLLQFAQMGSLYAREVLGIASPRVGLLNIGSEPSKGNELTLAAYELLKQTKGLNFIGNVEGRDVPGGDVDVIVCDGFVGNVMIKFAEGLVSAMFDMIKEELKKSVLTKVGAGLAMPGLKEMKRTLDYAEYGGAPLLGVQGVSIICHGSSRARAIKNAIRVAVRCVENRFVERIRQSVA